MTGQLVVIEELQVADKRSRAVLLLKLPNEKLQALALAQDDAIQALRNHTFDFGRDFNKQNDFQISFVKNLLSESNSYQIFKTKDGQSVMVSFNKSLRTKYFGESIERSVLEDVAIRLRGKLSDGGELVVVDLDNLLNLEKNGNKLCTLNGAAVLNQVQLEQSLVEVLKEFVSQGCSISISNESVEQLVHELNSKSTLNVGAASFQVGQPAQQQQQQQQQQRQQQQQPRRRNIPRHNFDVAAVASDEQIAPIFQELLNMQTDLYNQDFYSLDLRLKAAMHALVVACQNRDSFDYLNDMVGVFMDEYAEQWEQEG